MEHLGASGFSGDATVGADSVAPQRHVVLVFAAQLPGRYEKHMEKYGKPQKHHVLVIFK